MNGRDKNSAACRGEGLRGREQAREKERARIESTGSCFRAIGLAALVLAVVSPRAPADITVISRRSDASASAAITDKDGVLHFDFPPTQSQFDLLPANLSNSANVSNSGASATGNSTSVSSAINLDSSTDSLSVTGNGTAAGTYSPADLVTGSGNGGANLVILDFTLSDVSYTYTLTGQLSSTGFETPRPRHGSSLTLAHRNLKRYFFSSQVPRSIRNIRFSPRAGHCLRDTVNF